MQIFFGQGFLEQLTAWRLCQLEGHLGSGKTILAVAIAKWMYEEGLVRGVFSNFWIDPKFIPQVPSCVNTVVALDEAGEWADARDSMQPKSKGKRYGKFFRKLGSYLLTPSVDSVDRRIRPVTVKRWGDLWMLDTWVYRWEHVEGEHGYFAVRNYQDLFGAYNHEDIPADDGGILETLEREIEARRRSVKKVFVVGEPENLRVYGETSQEKAERFDREERERAAQILVPALSPERMEVVA